MKNPFKKKPRYEYNSSGVILRPQYGSCPICKKPEREWCEGWCKAVDPAQMARE